MTALAVNTRSAPISAVVQLIPSVANFRDVGGHATRDGRRVRTGRLYRSGALDDLRPADLPAFDALGIRVVVDLRTARERAARPDRLPAEVTHIVADMLASSAETSPLELLGALTDARKATETLGNGRGAAYFTRVYREFVLLDSARAALHRTFGGIAEAGRQPVLIHCTTGKDRTGWAAAVLLLWLGVPEEEVMTDFLASTAILAPIFQPTLDAFAAQGGDPAVLLPLCGVLPEYLEAALLVVRRAYGDLEGYINSGLGIDAATRRDLRAALVEAP